MNIFFILALAAAIFTGIGLAICLDGLIWMEGAERPTLGETLTIGVLFIIFLLFAILFYV